MIELFNKTGHRAYVSKIIVDGEEVECNDGWSVASPHREHSELEFMLLSYVQDKENKIGELAERVYGIENMLKKLESDKTNRGKNAKD